MIFIDLSNKNELYCKKIIASGRYDKNSMKDKLDVFLLAERITDDEYKELMQMMEG